MVELGESLSAPARRPPQSPVTKIFRHNLLETPLILWKWQTYFLLLHNECSAARWGEEDEFN